MRGWPRGAGVVWVAVLVLVAPAVGSACSSSLGPGDQLTGSWTSAGTQFSASNRAVVYLQACLRAEFAPVTLDANRDFTIASTALTITGNIRVTPETYLEVRGHFIGDNLQLQTRLVQLPLAVNDPVLDVLMPGALKSPPVCTA